MSRGTWSACLGLLALALALLALWFLREEPGSRTRVLEPRQVRPGGPSPDPGPPASVAGSLRGVLRLRPGGEPARGTSVALHLPGGGEATLVAETGTGGVFRLAPVPPGMDLEIRVAGRGIAAVLFPVGPLAGDEERDLGDLWIDPAASVTVAVRSMENDLPVAGAWVEAHAVPPLRSASDLWARTGTLGRSPDPAFQKETGADGTARFPDLPAGAWSFVAAKEGFTREGWTDPRSGRGDVELRGDEGEVTLTLRLARGLTLSGRVFDAAGLPVADAVVATGYGVLWNPPSHFSRTRTDAAGRYAFHDLRPGEILLLASRDGIALTRGPRVRLPYSGDVDIVLRTGLLEGTVYDADTGGPVPGATVVAMGIGRAEARTDGEGRYRIDSLPPGTVFLVVAGKEGWVPADTSEAVGAVLRRYPRVPWIRGLTRLEIPLRAGETVVHDLLLRRGARLSGTVRSAEGVIPWAKVTVVSRRAEEGFTDPVTATDAGGRFEFPAVPEGPVLVVAEKDGWCQPDFPPGRSWEESLNTGVPPTPHRLEIPATGAVVHDIVLSRGFALDGRVESLEGAALPGATVVASQVTFGYQERRAATDEGGRFRLAGLMPGVRVLVWAEKEGWYVADGAMAIEPAGGTSPPAPTLRMHRAARVQGVLTVASGRPLQGASVRVAVVTGRREESGRSVEEATPRMPVRSDGSYEAPVAATAEGEFTVVASAPGFREARSRPTRVVAGQEVYVVDLVLAEAQGLRGRVVAKGTGAGIAGARVGIGRRTDLAFATTDGDGRFAIEELDPIYATFEGGKSVYLVSAETEGFLRGHAEVAIGSREEVVLELAPAGD